MTPLRYSVALPQDSLALSTESVANQLIFEGERSMLLNAVIGQCTEVLNPLGIRPYIQCGLPWQYSGCVLTS
jgi:hypothetical protein